MFVIYFGLRLSQKRSLIKGTEESSAVHKYKNKDKNELTYQYKPRPSPYKICVNWSRSQTPVFARR